MADWKKNRQKFQMPHDRVERCLRYVKAVEKGQERAEKARKARFEALLLERWNARQVTKNGGVRAPRPTEGLGSDGQI